MQLRGFLSSLQCLPSRSKRRANASFRSARFEALERRTLLTGNVLVQVTDGNAVVTGDTADNSIEIIASGTTITVNGLNGTTINGATTAFTLSATSTTFAGSLTASLGDGSDTLAIRSGVIFSGDVVLNGEAGDDALGIAGATFNGDLRMAGGADTNVLSLQNATVSKNVTMTSGGPVTVNLSSTTIGGALRIETGDSADVIVLNNATITGRTKILSGGGNDDLVLQDSTLKGRLRVKSGEGDDVLYIDGTTLESRAFVRMQRGNDNVQIQGDSTLQRRSRIRGGAGSDAIEIEAPASAPRLIRRNARRTSVDDTLIDTRIENSTTGAIAKAAATTSRFSGGLSVAIAANSVAENAGASATTVIITRTGSTASALQVTLTSSNAQKAAVPSTVTIPAGASSVTATIAAIDNTVVDAEATVTITATATGLTSGTDTLQVTNNDVAALTVTASPTTVAENAGTGSVTYTVTRNTADLSQPMIVNLVSGTPTRLTVGTTVTIPANASSVTFTGTPVNNTTTDGAALVVVTASTTGLTSGTASVTVTDDDAANLTVTVNPTSVSESAGAGAAVLTVTRNNSSTTAALTVNVTLSSSTRLSVPTTITIPGGQTSASVTLSTINNTLVDGSAPITITVAATAFTSGSTLLTVTDDDTAALSLSLPTNQVTEGMGAQEAVISVNQVSATDRTVQLTYSNPGVVTGPASVVIPAGQTSAPVTFNIVPNSVPSDEIQVSIHGASPGVTAVSSNLTVEDLDVMQLTTDTSANVSISSTGIQITRDSTFQITGLTTAGATITVDSDGDGAFDDASTTATVDGSYSLIVPLTHTTTNNGRNDVVVRAVEGSDFADKVVPVHLAVGSVYRFSTNRGDFDVELLDTAAPITVQNFQSYAESAAYDHLMVHRSVNNFVVQAGGFTVTDGQVSSVATNAAIQNEFSAANPNVRGTLSMAQLGGLPNSGTSQWFVNLVDNSASLNAAQHTVFGRVIGDGMTVVDQINGLTERNLADLYQNSALSEVPLTNFTPANSTLTGTVSTVSGNSTLTGTGTLFTNQLAIGDSLRVSGKTYFVQSIQSDSSLTLTVNASATVTGITATKDVVPDQSEFVVFSDISEILALI